MLEDAANRLESTPWSDCGPLGEAPPVRSLAALLRRWATEED